MISITQLTRRTMAPDAPLRVLFCGSLMLRVSVQHNDVSTLPSVITQTCTKAHTHVRFKMKCKSENPNFCPERYCWHGWQEVAHCRGIADVQSCQESTEKTQQTQDTDYTNNKGVLIEVEVVCLFFVISRWWVRFPFYFYFWNHGDADLVEQHRELCFTSSVR